MGVPPGHMQPLGHPDFDASWAGAIDTVEDMDPETFWRKYWQKRPFKMKGFAKKSPAFTRWKDDDYLAEHYGKYKAKCENKMGYPNWKRWVKRLASMGSAESGKKLSKKSFWQYLKSFGEAGKGIKHFKKRAKEAFAAMDSDGDGSVEGDKLFRSRELLWLLKDIAVEQEGGRGDGEEDVEVARYDLQGNQVRTEL